MPAYNTDKYINESVQTALRQTYDNFELIIIDDGSTDSTPEFLDYISKVSSKIKVLRQKNKGPAPSRNKGIDNATGDYVLFLDSDDFLELNALETLNELANENNSPDIIVYGATPYPETIKDQWLEKTFATRDVVYNGFVGDILLKEAGTKPFIWQNCLKLSFINKHGLRINETLKLGEDQAFQFRYFPLSTKTVFTSKKLYKYRVSRNGSLMDHYNKAPLIKTNEHFKQAEIIYKSWIEDGVWDKYKVDYFNWYIDFIGWTILKLEDSKLKTEFAKKMCQFIEKNLDFPKFFISSDNREVIETIKTIANNDIDLVAELKRVTEEKNKLQKEYDDLINSQSYKLGKALTRKHD